MNKLLSEIQDCTLCAPHLALGPRPVLTAHMLSKIAIVGQAPGTKVHASGVPWDDASGKRLRTWLNVTDESFYDEENFAIIPMGFCYPGKGTSGDLPPRKECAPLWHDQLWEKMPNVQLTLLIGTYAQKYYLKEDAMRNLTETVEHYPSYLPEFFVLPHPSPRNRFWFTKNPWFDENVVSVLQARVAEILG